MGSFLKFGTALARSDEIGGFQLGYLPNGNGEETGVVVFWILPARPAPWLTTLTPQAYRR
jgi:hypothetical protein